MSRLAHSILIMFLCFGSLSYVPIQTSLAAVTVNKIAAVVNGEMITLHELQKATAAELYRQHLSQDDPQANKILQQILDSKINDILLRKEAERYKLSASDNEIESELKRFRDSTKLSPKAFEEQLKKQGMTMPSLKEQIKNNSLRQKIITFMIARKVIVTKEEIEKYYEEHKSDFALGKYADFSVIVFPPRVNVQGIYNHLKSGSLNFEETAKAYSLDSSGKNGGKVGKAPWGSISDNLKNLLSSLAPGQLSPLVQFGQSFAVVRLNKISDGKATSLSEAYPEIENVLREPRLQKRFVEYIQQLRSKAVIDIRI